MSYEIRCHWVSRLLPRFVSGIARNTQENKFRAWKEKGGCWHTTWEVEHEWKIQVWWILATEDMMSLSGPCSENHLIFRTLFFKCDNAILGKVMVSGSSATNSLNSVFCHWSATETNIFLPSFFHISVASWHFSNLTLKQNPKNDALAYNYFYTWCILKCVLFEKSPKIL